MTPSQRRKQNIKLRIKQSNEQVKLGLDPDPWVVEYRVKNNRIKANWKAKQPVKIPKPKLANSGSFKKGVKFPNRVSDAHRLESSIRWKENSNRWQKENKDKINEQRRNRRKSDAGFRLLCNLRGRLSFFLRSSIKYKTTKTLGLLGCTIDEFKVHLSNRFQEGMSFNNYGEWHIDHKIPCHSFNLTKKEDQKICFHFTNLQPLWAKDNRMKSNKIL